MATALLTHPACLGHVTPEDHPEQVARLAHVLAALEDLPLERHEAPEVSDRDLTRVHPQSYIDRIVASEPKAGVHQLDEDTWMSPGSVAAARRAAGGVLRAIDMVLGGEVANAFCATRPPGHHAETEVPMGFCLFGNAALGAKYALDHHGLSRVAVVDFDVHHGNGTQDLLWNEPRALFLGSHQMPLWPGTGRPEDAGPHRNIVNIPLDPKGTRAEMETAYEFEVFPRLEEFRPELLILSAGFDAHHADPLAQLSWETADFRWLTKRLCEVAKGCSAPVVSVLEGGYDLEALAASARVHVEALLEAGQ